MEERSINCLYGGLIGDALGGRYEFDCTGLIDDDLQRFGLDSHWEILGEGVYDLGAGQVTDDSEMAMALASSILVSGKVTRTAIAQAYHNWYLSDPFDIGKSTKNAVRYSSADQMIKAAKQFDQNCLEQYQSHNLSNGFLMRIGPLGVVCAGLISQNTSAPILIKQIVKLVSEDTLLTHPSLTALTYSTTFIILLGFAIVDGKFDRGYKLVKKHIKSHGDCFHILDAGLNLDSKLAHDPRKQIGDVRIAFQLAIRKAFLVQTGKMSFEEAIVSTVKLGGDTDTNACIVGYLCGAVSATIPQKWINSVVSVADGSAKDRYQKHKPNLLIKKIPDVSRILLTIGKELSE